MLKMFQVDTLTTNLLVFMCNVSVRNFLALLVFFILFHLLSLCKMVHLLMYKDFAATVTAFIDMKTTTRTERQALHKST